MPKKNHKKTPNPKIDENGAWVEGQGRKRRPRPLRLSQTSPLWYFKGFERHGLKITADPWTTQDWGAPTLHEVDHPPIAYSQPSVCVVPLYSWLNQPWTVQYCGTYYWKNLHIRETAQFKCVFFKGHLH